MNKGILKPLLLFFKGGGIIKRQTFFYIKSVLRHTKYRSFWKYLWKYVWYRTLIKWHSLPSSNVISYPENSVQLKPQPVFNLLTETKRHLEIAGKRERRERENKRAWLLYFLHNFLPISSLKTKCLQNVQSRLSVEQKMLEPARGERKKGRTKREINAERRAGSKREQEESKKIKREACRSFLLCEWTHKSFSTFLSRFL